MSRYIDADALMDALNVFKDRKNGNEHFMYGIETAKELLGIQPTVDAVPVPDGGIGELSDGYHTFNGLYYQRMMLFAALVKTYKDRAWKSRRHSDGEPCFGGGWFIVGIDTPQGGYTYHYEDKYFDLFDCVELPNGKEWDGHTEDDVTRLLTLDAVPVVRCRDCKWAEVDAWWTYCKLGHKEDTTNSIIYTCTHNFYCADGERRTDDGK